MKSIAFTPAFAAIVLIFTSLTSTFANPISVNSLSPLSTRELLNELSARSFDLDDFDLQRRGSGMSKHSKDPERKAKYDTGNPRPETPKGQFRPSYAGKKDDYFGDWQGMQKGVKNPAAGKGKYKRSELDFDLERRGSGMSKHSKDPERKAKYDTGNPRPETPVGQFRPSYAGKKDDYFGDWKGMQKGVKNPAAGKGKYKRDELDIELERRGSGMSKHSKDPERKAKYDTGNPRPETPKGQFRPSYAGKKDDYFGDWQGMQKGVKNPAAGKGKYKRQFDDEYELFF